MDRLLVPPTKIRHVGLDADEHIVNAVLIGRSLAGTARLYNSVGRFYFKGGITPPQSSEIRIMVGPPKPGSVWYVIYMMMAHGRMALYPELLFELAAEAVPAFVRAILFKITGQDENMEKALEIIDRQNERYHETVRTIQEDGIRSREQMLGIIGALASQNRSAMAELASPIGKTVRQTELVSQQAEPLLIDQPTADALTSKEDLKVGDTIKVRGLITALDVNTGSFRLEDTETGERFNGKITDPGLALPANIYSHALDIRTPVTLMAKPTLKADGSIHKLFVSDARND